MDVVWIEMSLQRTDRLLLGCVYRSPNSSLEEDCYLAEELTEACKRSFSHFLITGDFNHPEINWDTCSPSQNMHHKASRFLECIKDCFLHQNVKEATHHRGSQQANTLDLVFTNEEDMVKSIGIKSPLGKSHHCGLAISFNCYQLNGSLNSLLHCPKKKLNKKTLKLRNKPWINSQIMQMMRIRDKLFQQFKQTDSLEIYSFYKQFRNRVVNKQKTSKTKYFQNYFTENKSNMKLLWQGIRNVIKMKANDSEHSINNLTDENWCKITDPDMIASNFNNYFLNVANKITSKIPRNPNSALKYLNAPNNNSFFISPTVPDEVSSIIQSLKKNKSTGPNSIPVKLLKILDPHISVQLSQIINDSFQNGTFPEKLKIAKVIPIFKKGDASKNSNYRPISLLTIFSKIFEKLMHQRLYNFLELHEILFQMQFGFRNGHSTDHALISLSERIKYTLDSNSGLWNLH